MWNYDNCMTVQQSWVNIVMSCQNTSPPDVTCISQKPSHKFCLDLMMKTTLGKQHTAVHLKWQDTGVSWAKYTDHKDIFQEVSAIHCYFDSGYDVSKMMVCLEWFYGITMMAMKGAKVGLQHVQQRLFKLYIYNKASKACWPESFTHA